MKIQSIRVEAKELSHFKHPLLYLCSTTVQSFLNYFLLNYIPSSLPIVLSLQTLGYWALPREESCPTYFFPPSPGTSVGDPLRHLRGWCLPPPQATSNKALVISCSWLCHHFDFFNITLPLTHFTYVRRTSHR